MLRGQGFSRDQKFDAGLEIGPPLLKDLPCASISRLDQSTYGEVNLPPGRFRGAGHHILHRRQKGLRPGCIGPLPHVCVHSVSCHHLDGDLCRPLQIIGGSGRYVAVEYEALGGAASHQYRNPVFQLAR